MLKKTLTLLLLLSIKLLVIGQDATNYYSLLFEAREFYEKQQYEKSFLSFEKAFKINNKIPEDLYNCACTAALMGDSVNSLKFLNEAVNYGYTDYKQLSTDCDLRLVHYTKPFQEIFDKALSNSLKEKTFDIFINEVSNIITNNDFESFKKYIDHKSNLDTIQEKFEQINNLLRQNNSRLKILNTNQGFSSSYEFKQKKDLDKIETFDYSVISTESLHRVISKSWKSFRIMPLIFNDLTDKSIRLDIGPTVKINIQRIKNNYYITSLSIENPTFKPDFEISNWIKDYINNLNKFEINAEFISTDKVIFGGLIDTVYNMGCFRDIKITKTLKDLKSNNTNKIYSIIFKNNPQGVAQSIVDVSSNSSDKKTFNYLEIVFEKGSKNVLIINEEYYGIYLIDNVSDIQAWIDKVLTP